MFALTVIPTSGTPSPITNAFTPLPPTASPRHKPAFVLNCPTLTTSTQLIGMLSQVTGDFGIQQKEVLQSMEDGFESTEQWERKHEARSSLGYAQ